jgi:hypothetical protein
MLGRLPFYVPRQVRWIDSYSESMNTPKVLENKVCLVTGGTRGIAPYRNVAGEGAMVVVCGRGRIRSPGVSEMEARWPGKAKGKAADVSGHEQVRALFEFVTAKTAAPTSWSTTRRWNIRQGVPDHAGGVGQNDPHQPVGGVLLFT